MNKPELALKESNDVHLTPIARYLNRCNLRVKNLWNPPKGGMLGVIIVACRIHADGKLSNVVLKSTTTDPVVTRTALHALHNAAPFEPLPPGSPLFLDLELVFEYGLIERGDAIDKPKASAADLKAWANDCNERIRRQWNPPRGLEPGLVTLSCRVFKDGSITHIKLERTTCGVNVTQAAMMTLQACSPFNPMPPASPEYVDLKFNFDYGFMYTQNARPTDSHTSLPAQRAPNQQSAAMRTTQQMPVFGQLAETGKAPAPRRPDQTYKVDHGYVDYRAKPLS